MKTTYKRKAPTLWGRMQRLIASMGYVSLERKVIRPSGFILTSATFGERFFATQLEMLQCLATVKGVNVYGKNVYELLTDMGF